MTSTAKKDELAEKHPDADWRGRLVRIAFLSDLLGSCIISSQYRVPDELAAAIHLTGEGSRILQEAVSKHKIPAKDVKLMCLLEIFHQDLLVDVDTTDLEALETAIGNELRLKRVRIAPVLGRHLYDRAAELFEDLENYLTVDQTTALLDGMPQGVSQFGFYLTGPTGLTRLPFQRYFATSRYLVPLFHCADPSCSLVHRATLSTDWDAPINDKRNEFKRLMERESRDPSDWADFIADLVEDEAAPFDDNDLSTLPYFLGDAFSETELAALLSHLLDAKNGAAVRQRLGSLGLKNSGSASDVVRKLDHYSLLNYFLTFPDPDLAELLDEAVLRGVIHVPRTEVRKAVLFKGFRASGQYHAQVEIGALGHRVATHSSVAPQRLTRLIRELWKFESFPEEEELELDWALRHIEGETVRGRLEDFMRTGTPEEVLRTLVLCKRTNVLTACHRLGVEDTAQSDDELLSAFMWKLGFDAPVIDPSAASFWRVHGLLEHLLRGYATSGVVNTETLRAHCGIYFPEVERVLLNSLLFATWALLFDHYASNQPFTYVPDEHRLWAMAELNTQLQTSENLSDDEFVPVYVEDKIQLGQIVQGFDLLADRLAAVLADSGAHLRNDADKPRFIEHTELQAFPFRHTVPVLDLVQESAHAIISTLRAVQMQLVSAEVMAARNDYAHYRHRRSPSSVDRLSGAVDALRSVIGRLEGDGFSLVEYRRTEVTSDSWGRQTHTLTDIAGRTYVSTTPSEFEWVRLPPLRRPQLVLRAATFRQPDECFRFEVRSKSAYADLWSNFPQRRRRHIPVGGSSARQEARADHADHEAPNAPR